MRMRDAQQMPEAVQGTMRPCFKIKPNKCPSWQRAASSPGLVQMLYGSFPSALR